MLLFEQHTIEYRDSYISFSVHQLVPRTTQHALHDASATQCYSHYAHDIGPVAILLRGSGPTIYTIRLAVAFWIAPSRGFNATCECILKLTLKFTYVLSFAYAPSIVRSYTRQLWYPEPLCRFILIII
jgi:hypothetical protein